MSNLQVREQAFVPRDFQKPALDFAGMWAAMHTSIKLRVHESVLDRVLDYCSCEDCSRDGAGHYIVRFPFIDNDYYYHILLSFGDQCECLEPSHVRAEMRRRAQKIAALYGQ